MYMYICIGIVVRVARSCFLRNMLLPWGVSWRDLGRTLHGCTVVAIVSQHNEGHVHVGWVEAREGKGRICPAFFAVSAKRAEPVSCADENSICRKSSAGGQELDASFTVPGYETLFGVL